jgi:predicted nucleic acid-binding protein
MTAVLIDTNVLLYAYDAGDRLRHEAALHVLKQREQSATGRFSVQCLAEFFSVSTRKLKPPMTPAEALQEIELISRSFPVFDLTVPVVTEAARGVRDHHIAYYDAQLWATARLHQIPLVFSEDFSSGQVIEGVRFVNPFVPDFVLDTWI